MAFDPTTASPVKTGFDPLTAIPLSEEQTVPQFDPSTSTPVNAGALRTPEASSVSRQGQIPSQAPNIAQRRRDVINRMALTYRPPGVQTPQSQALEEEARGIRAEEAQRREDIAPLLAESEEIRNRELAEVEANLGRKRDEISRSVGLQYYQTGAGGRSEELNREAVALQEEYMAPNLRMLARNAQIFTEAGVPADFENEWNRITKGGEWAEKLPFSPAGLVKMAELNRIVRKVKNGDPLSAYETARIDEFASDRQMLEEVGKTVGAGIFQGVTDMFPYMLEFVSTGGLADVARVGVTKALGRYAENRVISTLSRGTVAALSRTLAQPNRVIEGTLERRLNQVDLKDGKAVINTDVPQRSLLSSFYSSFVDTFAENASEEAGPVLMGLFGKLSAKTRNKLVKMGLWKAAKEANPNIKPSQFMTAMRRLGKGGIVEEWTEERYGAVLRELFGVDRDDSNPAITARLQRITYGSMSELLTELGVLAVGGGPSTVAGIINKGRMSRAEAKALQQVRDDLGTILEEQNISPELRGAVEAAVEDPSQENIDSVNAILGGEVEDVGTERGDQETVAPQPGVGGIKETEGGVKETPRAEPEVDPEIRAFAERIARGETIESPEDFQFYRNNAQPIEAELQNIQEAQNAIQEQEAAQVPTREEAQTGKEVGQEVRQEGEEVTPDIIGFSTRQLNIARQMRGEEELTEQEAKSHAESMRRAIENGDNVRADDLAERVVASENTGKTVQMSDQEVAGMGARVAELRTERSQLFASLNSAIQDGNENLVDEIRQQIEQNARKADLIESALKTSATASGRANSVMASFINRFTYDVVNLQDTARQIKGAELTEEEQTGLIDVGNRIQEIEAQIANLKDQIRTGNFEETKKRKRKDEPAELTEAKRILHQLQREAREKLYNIREKTARDYVKMVATLPRTLIATADMSYGLRQGLIPSLGHPKIASGAWRAAFKSFFSQNTADEIDVEMREHPRYDEIVGYGTHFSNMDSAIESREEFFASSIAERIPGFGAVVRASERNMVTGLNMLRFGLMNDFIQRHPDASTESKKAYARYINIVTGRGQAQMLDRSAEELSLVFFAPRFAFSRVQSPYEAVRMMKHNELRGEIVRQWVSLLVTGFTILALAKAAGADVGDDPNDSDWGKIIIDNKIRIDIFGGLQQPLRILAKTIKGGYEYKTTGKTETNPIVDIFNFLKYKLSPPIMMANELITGEDIIGRDVEPMSPFGVDMPKSATTVVRNITPLIIQSAAESYKEELDPTVITGLAIGEGLGLSIGVYEKENRSKVRYKPVKSF